VYTGEQARVDNENKSTYQWFVGKDDEAWWGFSSAIHYPCWILRAVPVEAPAPMLGPGPMPVIPEQIYDPEVPPLPATPCNGEVGSTIPPQ
jgi:hypothetical protein